MHPLSVSIVQTGPPSFPSAPPRGKPWANKHRIRTTKPRTATKAGTSSVSLSPGTNRSGSGPVSPGGHRWTLSDPPSQSGNYSRRHSVIVFAKHGMLKYYTEADDVWLRPEQTSICEIPPKADGYTKTLFGFLLVLPSTSKTRRYYWHVRNIDSKMSIIMRVVFFSSLNFIFHLKF